MLKRIININIKVTAYHNAKMIYHRPSSFNYFHKRKISYRIKNGNKDRGHSAYGRYSGNHHPIHSCMYAVFFKKTLHQKS